MLLQTLQLSMQEVIGPWQDFIYIPSPGVEEQSLQCIRAMQQVKAGMLLSHAFVDSWKTEKEANA